MIGDRAKQASCSHARSNPWGCLDCKAPWCSVCRTHHAGNGTVGPSGWEDPNPWPCVERMRARVSELEAALRPLADQGCPDPCPNGCCWCAVARVLGATPDHGVDW